MNGMWVTIWTGKSAQECKDVHTKWSKANPNMHLRMKLNIRRRKEEYTIQKRIK